jgi:hypothetical protein
MPVLVATTTPSLAAGEPVGATPPCQSIREWKTSPNCGVIGPTTPTPAAATPVATTLPARSIREWNPNPNPAPAPAPNPAASPAASPAPTPAPSPVATPAAIATAPKTPVTISIKSTLRQGNLVVMLDDVPVFNEKFQKPVLLISQTTRWDPLQVPAGKHTLSAKVYGTKKTYFSATYDLDVSRTKASELRFVMQDDRLTVELGS